MVRYASGPLPGPDDQRMMALLDISGVPPGHTGTFGRFWNDLPCFVPAWVWHQPPPVVSCSTPLSGDTLSIGPFSVGDLLPPGPPDHEFGAKPPHLCTTVLEIRLYRRIYVNPADLIGENKTLIVAFQWPISLRIGLWHAEMKGRPAFGLAPGRFLFGRDEKGSCPDNPSRGTVRARSLRTGCRTRSGCRCGSFHCRPILLSRV
jgi:hypothetical protein